MWQQDRVSAWHYATLSKSANLPFRGVNRFLLYYTEQNKE